MGVSVKVFSLLWSLFCTYCFFFVYLLFVSYVFVEHFDSVLLFVFWFSFFAFSLVEFIFAVSFACVRKMESSSSVRMMINKSKS